MDCPSDVSGAVSEQERESFQPQETGSGTGRRPECFYSQILATGVHQVHLVNGQPPVGFSCGTAAQGEIKQQEMKVTLSCV